MAGYLFAYFNFSVGKVSPAPHFADIRGSSRPLPVLPIPVLAFFPRSLLFCELCCCSALTAMVTSKRHSHLLHQAKEKSTGVCVCVCTCQERKQDILFFSLFIFMFKAFHYSAGKRPSSSRMQREAVGQQPCAPSCCPSRGRG